MILENQNYNEISPHMGQNGYYKKKSTNNKCWRGCGQKGSFLHYWCECKLVQPLWRTAWRLLKKLKLELPYDPAIPLLGICPEKNMIQRIYAPQWSLQHCLQYQPKWKQPKCPSTEEWIKRMWYIYTMEYYSAKKEQSCGIFRDVDGLRDCHTEWSKSGRVKLLICGI